MDYLHVKTCIIRTVHCTVWLLQPLDPWDKPGTSLDVDSQDLTWRWTLAVQQAYQGRRLLKRLADPVPADLAKNSHCPESLKDVSTCVEGRAERCFLIIRKVQWSFTDNRKQHLFSSWHRLKTFIWSHLWSSSFFSKHSLKIDFKQTNKQEIKTTIQSIFSSKAHYACWGRILWIKCL